VKEERIEDYRMLSGGKEGAPHNRSSTNKKEEKGYEKDNLFNWHRFAFRFAGNDELHPGTKNNRDKKQFVHSQRELAGVDDL